MSLHFRILMVAVVSLAPLPVLLATPSSAEAQVCRRGKPCGNTCIARNRTCRVGPGTARAAGAAGTTPPVTATSSSNSMNVTVPEGMTFVASTRGRTYYWVECTAWRTLAAANLQFFAAREEAEEVGLTVSAQAECRGPEGGEHPHG